MRTLLLGVAAATSILGVSAPFAGAQAQPSAQLIFGVDTAADRPSLEQVQFLYGGRNFCWYDGGWRGPGFYWCGYARRSGLGWGGGSGWNGWRGGGGHGGSRGGGSHQGGAGVRGGNNAGGHAGGSHAGGSHTGGAAAAVSHGGGASHAGGGRSAGGGGHAGGGHAGGGGAHTGGGGGHKPGA